MPMTILLAEDEGAIAETVLYALRAEGYAAEHVLLGGEVLPRLRRGGIDLVILDVGLPDTSGFDVCRALRQFYRKAAGLDARSTLLLELLVRPDDSPLRMNGSGMLLLNAPWQFDVAMRPALDGLCAALGEAGGSARVEWLRLPA